jgi:hypothetical protein
MRADYSIAGVSVAGLGKERNKRKAPVTGLNY